MAGVAAAVAAAEGRLPPLCLLFEAGVAAAAAGEAGGASPRRVEAVPEADIAAPTALRMAPSHPRGTCLCVCVCVRGMCIQIDR